MLINFLTVSVGIAVIHGEQKDADSDQVDGRSSPPAGVVRRMDTGPSVFDSVPSLAAKEKPPLTIVGDVGGHIAIMVVRLLIQVFDRSRMYKCAYFYRMI